MSNDFSINFSIEDRKDPVSIEEAEVGCFSLASLASSSRLSSEVFSLVSPSSPVSSGLAVWSLLGGPELLGRDPVAFTETGDLISPML